MLLLVAAAVGLFTLAHTAPFPFFLDWGRSRAVWDMPSGPSDRTIFLTFDDGPNPAATPALLDLLRREQVPATFFLIDRHITDATAPIVRRIADEGHAIALHSHTRAPMFYTPEKLAAMLERASSRIEAITGRPPCRAFRPHAGFRSSAMYAGLDRAGYVLVGWGWNLWDWNWFRRKTAESVAPRLARLASPGDILVLHDGHHENPRADRGYTIETVARLIPLLRARDLEFGTICDPATGEHPRLAADASSEPVTGPASAR